MTKLNTPYKTINLSGKPVFNTKGRRLSQEDEYEEVNENFLSFCARSYSTNILSIPIDGEFRDPSYYRHVVQAISGLEEGDQVEFNISSPGGMYDGLVALLSALHRTQATSIAIIAGRCHSAASILALNCDVIAVSDYANMLCHYVNYGAGGPANHVRKEVDHVEKISQRLFRDTYKHFLTEEEIDMCIEHNNQLWLDSTEILERLQYRQEMQKKEAEETLDEDCDCISDDTDSYGGTD